MSKTPSTTERNVSKKALPLSMPQYILDAIEKFKKVDNRPSTNNAVQILLEEILAQKGYIE